MTRMSTAKEKRGHRKERVGEVISDRMQRTIIVRVLRRVHHPLYRKVITLFSKCYVHDEREEARIGDQVRIRETRPLSKTKSWRLVEILRRAGGGKGDGAEAR